MLADAGVPNSPRQTPLADLAEGAGSSKGTITRLAI
jgi:hypothetical protein